MEVIKLFDIAMELQSSGLSGGSYKGVIEYGFDRGKDIVIFNDAMPEEDLKVKQSNNVQFFTASFQVARKVKKIIKKADFPVKADIFSSIKEKAMSIIVLNVTGTTEELQDALSALKDSDSIAISKAIS